MLDERPDLRLIVVARGEQPELPRTTVLRGDLASLRTVRAIADDIDEPLDGFVGNADAQLKTGNTSTVDGYETTFAVNVRFHPPLRRQPAHQRASLPQHPAYPITFDGTGHRPLSNAVQHQLCRIDAYDSISAGQRSLTHRQAIPVSILENR
jgi:hypothetical protein